MLASLNKKQFAELAKDILDCISEKQVREVYEECKEHLKITINNKTNKMKKYISKNADGSKQNVMQAVHDSRKEAGETLMDYICDHNEDMDVDDYLSPFDFALEEVECKEVNEVITDFESARKALGLKPNDFELSGCISKFTDVVQLIRAINPKHIEALIALNKLFTIAQAWNKEDGFVPDFSDCNQKKWYPWFRYDKDAARFVYAHTLNANANATIGSRLCFKSSARAAQFGKQFANLYNKFFL